MKRILGLVLLIGFVSCIQDEIIPFENKWTVSKDYVDGVEKLQLIKQNTIDSTIIISYEVTCDSINEDEILRLVNQIRTVGYILEDDTNKFITSSLKPLTWDNDLKTAAAIQSTYMVENNDYSHNWDDGTGLSNRIYWSGFQNNAKEGIGADENIARGHRTEATVVKGWLNSKPHREAMLKSNRDVVAVAKRTHPEGSNYWTMVLSYKGYKL